MFKLLQIPLFVLFIGLLSLTACTSKIDQSAQSITETSIKKHIIVLSSDEFQGRAPATEGEEMTVDYLVNEFKNIGLTGGLENDEFVQDVPATGQSTLKMTMLLRSNGQNRSLEYQKDFMAMSRYQDDRVDLKNLELIYVGYGIQAPEEEWDDFKGVDVRGKVIVIKNSDPADLEGKFGGKARLYYGRYSYKYEIAEKLGAAGALIIHTTPTAGYGWQVVSNSFALEQFSIQAHNNREVPTGAFNGWLSEEAAQHLFKENGKELESMLEQADDQNFKPISLSRTKLSTTIVSSFREIVFKNVAAKISGTSTETKDEYIVFSAHHDHLGMTENSGSEDTIYNGARDNASGLSVMLNLARAYKLSNPFLGRSMLFVAVGGEEKGLLGSSYFVQNSPVQPGRIAANINLDAMNIYGNTKDVILIGYGRSDLDTFAENRAAEQGRTAKPDQEPDKGFYYRSDHFSFAKAGIPSLYISGGKELTDYPATYYKEKVIPHLAKTYHTVYDEIDEMWDFRGLVQDARLIYYIGLDIAGSSELPSWYQGDEFEQIRLKSIEILEK